MLLANKKNSKAPGDNDQMVRARFDFLKKDYYAPLASALAESVKKNAKKKSAILDAGCGCGYYLSAIKNTLEKGEFFGVDISKSAVKLASKKDKVSNYAVASVYDLPFSDKAFDVVLCVFSPHAFEEYHRVLKDDGVLIVVYPAEKHLLELKRLLYKNQTTENDKVLDNPLFFVQESENVSYEIDVENNADLISLFKMTPYSYTTPLSATEVLGSIENISITCDFKLEVLRKR